MTTHRWSFQETSGASLVDDIGANDGTIDETVSLGVAGPSDEKLLAADFSGSSVNPVELDQTFTLSRKHDWSIKFWAKQDSVNQEGMILGDRDTQVSFIWLTSSQSGLTVRPAHAVEVTGSNNGLDITFPLPATTRTSWTEYALTYSAAAPNPQLTLAVNDVVVASEAALDGIELRINTLGGGHTSSTFALDGQLAGVELAGTEIDYAKPDKIALVLGQSNAEGRFANHQAYSHPTKFASVFADGEWGELFDEGTYGEVWPLVATRWLADREESVGFIYAAEGGTGLVEGPDWANGGAAYDAAISAVVASGVDHIDVVLWFQGERDANQNVSEEAYEIALIDLVARLHADIPGDPPLICGQINSVTDGTTNGIRNAQMSSWSQEHIHAGPVTFDIGPLADDLHFTTDAEAEILAERWWATIDEAIFNGTHGTPPRLQSAEVDEAIVTLEFDRELESATDYDAAAWTFLDNGAAINVTSATQLSPKTVTLSLDHVPLSSLKSLTLGTNFSAQGLEVPRGLGSQPALPETFSVSVPAQQKSGAASIRESIAVNTLRRAVFVD